MYEQLSTTGKLARQCVDNSERWFGDTVKLGTLDALVHHVLSLCGEAGEVANLVKKVHRGSLDLHDAGTRHDLVMEITDVYTYLLNIAGMLNVDLEKAYL